jgi:hypothetical protein
MFDPKQNPWRVEYRHIDGLIVRVENVPPYVYAPFNPETGEVEVGDFHAFDDDLGELAQPWVWKKFNMVDATT